MVAPKNWMTELTKEFGVCASQVKPFSDNVIKIPSPSFNWMVGNGGIPEGASVLLYGPENGGKSLIRQLIEIAIQKKHPEGIIVNFDAEWAFNPEWFKKLGGDPDRVYLRKTNDPVKIFDFIEKDLSKMITEGCPIKSISIDSIKAIRFPKDIKKTSTDMVMGGTGAAYLSSALKAITPVLKDNNITNIFVQQVYEEMDQYKKLRSPFLVPDGRSLKHHSDIMIQVERLQTKEYSMEAGTTIAGTDMQIGHTIRTRCTKSRLDSPHRVAQFSLEYTKGIVNQDIEIYNLGKSLGIIKHPISPETGRENNKLWVIGNHEPILGEANMLEAVRKDVKLQEEILEASYKVEAVHIENMTKAIESLPVNFET